MMMTTRIKTPHGVVKVQETGQDKRELARRMKAKVERTIKQIEREQCHAA